MFEEKIVLNKNKEIIDSLRDTLKKNTACIDWVVNNKNVMKDRLEYNCHDDEASYSYEQLSYLEFVLFYLDKQCMASFKKLGGKL